MTNGFLGMIITALTALAGLITSIAYKLGKERGRDEVIEEQEQASQQAEEKREKKEEEVKARPDEQAKQDISKWFRD